MKHSKVLFNWILTLTLLLTLSNPNSGFCQETHEVTMSDLMFDDQYYDVLSKAMAKPEHVKYLDIAMQDLKVFPKELCTLPNLERLSVGFNYFQSLPADIGKLEKLVFLDISGTHADIRIPDAIGQLKNLKEFKMEDMLNLATEKRIKDKINKLLPDCKVITGHTK